MSDISIIDSQEVIFVVVLVVVAIILRIYLSHANWGNYNHLIDETEKRIGIEIAVLSLVYMGLLIIFRLI